MLAHTSDRATLPKRVTPIKDYRVLLRCEIVPIPVKQKHWDASSPTKQLLRTIELSYSLAKLGYQ